MKIYLLKLLLFLLFACSDAVGQTKNELKMIDEINKLRVNPDIYIQILDSMRESYLWNYNFIVSGKKNDTVNLENWREEVENDSLIFYPIIYECGDAISFLKNVGAVPPLRLDSQLYIKQRNINYTNLYSSINDEMYFTGIDCFESITSERDIVQAITGLLIDSISEEDMNNMRLNRGIVRRNRTNLMNPSHSMISAFEVKIEGNSFAWVLGFLQN